MKKVKVTIDLKELEAELKQRRRSYVNVEVEMERGNLIVTVRPESDFLSLLPSLQPKYFYIYKPTEAETKNHYIVELQDLNRIIREVEKAKDELYEKASAIVKRIDALLHLESKKETENNP